MSPTYFAPESVIGGGERFAEELSRAMSAQSPVRFISFGPKAFRERVSGCFERVILKSWTRDRMTPFSPHLWRELRGSSVIHCHQYFVLPTFLAALHGWLHGIPVFVSDLGGGGWTPAYQVDQSRWIRAHLPISQYAAKRLPGRNKICSIIYGGVDLAHYPMRPHRDHDGTVVFLGRILPHKGVHLLLEGVPADMPVRIIGPVGNAAYYAQLRSLARGKNVEFLHDLADGEIAAKLRAAMALVHPTPTDREGDAGANELFGLAVVEAMASGCPVIVSAAASLPELVEPEVSGIVVPPNNPAAIHDELFRLKNDDALWRRLSVGARQRAEAEFAWSRVVERCLAAYATTERAR